jgi:hypothetical protein
LTMEMRKTTADGLEPPVLEDASGRRASWMRRTGRLVYLLFLAWLVAIVLGGLGLTPVPRIPFTHALRLSQGPPQLAQMPRPRPPSALDLRPALPASALAAHGGSGRAAPQTRGQARGRSSSAPGKGTVPRGRGSTALGHTKTNPSGSHRKVPPGRTRTTRTTTTPVPPGHTRTTTTPGLRGKR